MGNDLPWYGKWCAMIWEMICNDMESDVPWYGKWFAMVWKVICHGMKSDLFRFRLYHSLSNSLKLFCGWMAGAIGHGRRRKSSHGSWPRNGVTSSRKFISSRFFRFKIFIFQSWQTKFQSSISISKVQSSVYIKSIYCLIWTDLMWLSEILCFFFTVRSCHPLGHWTRIKKMLTWRVLSEKPALCRTNRWSLLAPSGRMSSMSWQIRRIFPDYE